MVIDYVVRWKGYGPEHNTWEPEANLTDCDEVLQGYWNRPHAASVPLSDGMRTFVAARTAADAITVPDTGVESAVSRLALRLLQKAVRHRVLQDTGRSGVRRTRPILEDKPLGAAGFSEHTIAQHGCQVGTRTISKYGRWRSKGGKLGRYGTLSLLSDGAAPR